MFNKTKPLIVLHNKPLRENFDSPWWGCLPGKGATQWEDTFCLNETVFFCIAASGIFRKFMRLPTTPSSPRHLYVLYFWAETYRKILCDYIPKLVIFTFKYKFELFQAFAFNMIPILWSLRQHQRGIWYQIPTSFHSYCFPKWGNSNLRKLQKETDMKLEESRLFKSASFV